MIAILADAFVKATVLLVLAAVVTVFLRRSPASLRHFVWALACGGVLALPLAAALLPNWRVAGWPRLDVPVAFNAEQIAGVPEPAAPEPAPQPRAAVTAAAVHVQDPATTSALPDGAERWRLTTDWTALVLPVWLGGALAVLILLGVALARIMWLDRVTRPVQDEAWLVLVEELSLEVGLPPPLPLLGGHRPPMPMTRGISPPPSFPPG